MSEVFTSLAALVAASSGATPLVWVSEPDPSEISRHYPDLARELEIEVDVEVTVALDGEGLVESCRVARKAHHVLGLAEASCRVASLYVAQPSEGAAKRHATVVVPWRLPPRADGAPRPRWLLGPKFKWYPNRTTMKRYYPTGALFTSASGQATVQMTFDAKGAVRDCVVVTETQPVIGFGRATCQVVAKMGVPPRTETGESVEGMRTLFTMKWGIIG